MFVEFTEFKKYEIDFLNANKFSIIFCRINKTYGNIISLKFIVDVAEIKFDLLTMCFKSIGEIVGKLNLLTIHS